MYRGISKYQISGKFLGENKLSVMKCLYVIKIKLIPIKILHVFWSFNEFNRQQNVSS